VGAELRGCAVGGGGDTANATRTTVVAVLTADRGVGEGGSIAVVGVGTATPHPPMSKRAAAANLANALGQHAPFTEPQPSLDGRVRHWRHASKGSCLVDGPRVLINRWRQLPTHPRLPEVRRERLIGAIEHRALGAAMAAGALALEWRLKSAGRSPASSSTGTPT
jgi:hypothetical protein